MLAILSNPVFWTTAINLTAATTFAKIIFKIIDKVDSPSRKQKHVRRETTRHQSRGALNY